MERLQKILASGGIGSRRQCEKYIEEGKVAVNGEIVTVPGFKVNPTRDEITFEGNPVIPKPVSYVILHKPLYCLTTKKDPRGRKTIMHLLPEKYKNLNPAGRLDWDSQGLVFLTNDGELIYRLTHPGYEVYKTYKVLIPRPLKKEEIDKLKTGIRLEDGLTYPAKVSAGAHEKEVIIKIHEGKNRQIRRMFANLGLEIINLKRISLGPLKLKGLKPGEFRHLEDHEIRELKKLVNYF